MKCPNCNKDTATKHEDGGKNPHKQNTAWCTNCGRVPLDAPVEAAPATETAVEETPVESQQPSGGRGGRQRE